MMWSQSSTAIDIGDSSGLKWLFTQTLQNRISTICPLTIKSDWLKSYSTMNKIISAKKTG